MVSAILALAPLMIFALASDTRATGFDGSVNLICSSIDTVQCDADGFCVNGRAQDINMPQFFRLNFQENVIRRKTGEGTERSSKIDALRHSSGEMILQGVEEGMGWTMLIDEASGRMTITASTDDTAFIVFGACTED